MVDCHIPIEEFDPLLKRIIEKKKIEDKRLAFLGTLEVTPYCNLRCVHCYVTHAIPEGQLLTREEWFRIIDEIADEGCFYLLLTGGEPFLRDDFLDIYTHAKRKGMFITIFTNGTLITPEIAAYLRELPPMQVEISLYGATQETYESITGKTGSFGNCLQGIELLLENNISLRLKTMLMTLNKHEYYDMKKLAINYGLEMRMDGLIHADLNGSQETNNYRVSPEELTDIDVQDPPRREAYTLMAKNTPVVSQDLVFTCGAGSGRFHIDAFGKLQMCTIVREPSYDLRQGTFSDGWHRYLNEVRQMKLNSVSPCRTCQYRSTCDVCPGWALLEYGTLEERPIEYLCQITKLRADKLAKAAGV